MMVFRCRKNGKDTESTESANNGDNAVLPILLERGNILREICIKI